jgi:hypothetical protein
MFPQTGNMDMGDPHPNPVATPVAPDPAAAARAKMISGALRAGAQQTPQGSMVGGHYVPPSFAQQLAPAASAAGYGYLQGQ